jgi:hypothetical protein
MTNLDFVNLFVMSTFTKVILKYRTSPKVVHENMIENVIYVYEFLIIHLFINFVFVSKFVLRK